MVRRWSVLNVAFFPMTFRVLRGLNRGAHKKRKLIFDERAGSHGRGRAWNFRYEDAQCLGHRDDQAWSQGIVAPLTL